MEEDTSLSRPEIYQIAWQVRDDEADPEEVRKLLEYLCTLIDREDTLPPEAHRYIRDSLSMFLDGSAKNLDGAFGLKKRNLGRRKKSRKTELEMATEVLRLRLAGSKHRPALDDVASQFHKENTTISDAWSDWKQDALVAIRLERDPDKFPWSEKEMQRLEKIFKKEQQFLRENGYLAPENQP